MAPRRSKPSNLDDNVLILELCPPSVQSLLLSLADQGEFRILYADPLRCVFWSDIDAYSAPGSGPDHEA